MIEVEKYFDDISNKDEVAFPKANVICVAKIGSSLFVGWNSEKTSPSFRRSYPCGTIDCQRHAEMHVINQIPRGSCHKNIKIFIVRKTKDGSLSMAKPCHHCQQKLKNAGIDARNIYFTNWSGEWIKLGNFDE